MRSIVCYEFGNLRSLGIADSDAPTPGPGQVLVEVQSAGVSFVDGLVARGAYQVKPPLPFTPGNCAAGRVVGTGEGVSDEILGSQVATVLPGIGGAYTTHLVVGRDALASVPDGLDLDVVAASMESYLTMTFATTDRVQVAAGDQVVVVGGGGGIGLAAIDIARSLGAVVTAVASSPEKRSLAELAGATRTLGYDDLKDAIRDATGGGADVVIDPVGGEHAEAALRALATGGRYCVVGFASGDIPRFPMNVVLLRNRSIVGVDWGDWSREIGGPQGNARLLETILGRMASGDLEPPRPTVVPLDQAGEILDLIANRQAVGKYVLRP